MTATAADVAPIIEGAKDYDEAIQRIQDAGLTAQVWVGHLQVGTNVAVSQVGGNTRAKAYWIVYDIDNPEKSKIKVAGG